MGREAGGCGFRCAADGVVPGVSRTLKLSEKMGVSLLPLQVV